MIITSQYDSWLIYNGTEIGCVTDGKVGKTLTNCSSSDFILIEKNRRILLDFLDMWAREDSKNSVWAISCSTHMYLQFDDFYDSPNQKVPGVTGYKLREAVEKFVLEGEKIYMVDDVAWPGNALCAY